MLLSKATYKDVYTFLHMMSWHVQGDGKQESTSVKCVCVWRRQLQFVPTEESQLKYMTGEWFYAVKSQRHQDRIHGSEIIWASMRQKKPGQHSTQGLSEGNL